MNLSFHLASEIFDLLADAEFASLCEDIRKHGLLTPIWLHPDGSILDGRNRYRACMEVGVAPAFCTWHGTGGAAEFVWPMNFTRGHLDGNARKMAAARYAIELEREARKRQVAQLKRGDVVPSPSIEGDGEFGASAQKAADKFDVGRATVERAITVLKKADPELVAKVETGEVSIAAAADIAAEYSKPEQREIVVRGEKEILDAAKCIRSERAEQKRAENAALKAATPVLVPTGKYQTIVIDPPWDTEKIEREVRPNQVAFDYPTMTEAELAAYPVPDLACDDCHLFCWTTQKFLLIALRLIELWGFRYVLEMVWHKPGGFQPVGLPQYNGEFVVYGRKGTPEFADTTAFPCCFNADRREHSRKLDEFYDLIRRVTPGPRIDVFSREPRDGFAQYGNEINKFSESK